MKKLTILFMALCFSLNSSAGLLIEPMLGVSFLSDGDVSTDSVGDYSLSSTTFAVRLGYSALGLRGGLYYGNTLSANLEREATSGSFDYEMSRTDLGLFFGI